MKIEKNILKFCFFLGSEAIEIVFKIAFKKIYTKLFNMISDLINKYFIFVEKIKVLNSMI